MPSFPIVIDTQYAENVNTNGNRCGVTFSPPLQIPRDASPRLRLYSASLAYNFPNASAAIGNNTLLIERTIGGIVHEHTVTFEDGLYGSLDDVQRVISHSLLQDSNINFNDFTITIVGVAATQKAHISITTDASDSIILRFAAPNSIGALLGFTTDKIFWPFSTTSCESDTTASLDRTTSVFVTTSLCSGSVVAGKGG